MGKINYLRLERSTAADDLTSGRAGAMPEFNATDLGNAERFVSQHGRYVRYLTERRSWLVYRNGRWQFDAENEIFRLVKQTIRSIKNDVADDNEDGSYERAASFALKCEDRGRISAMIGLAQSEMGIAVGIAKLDLDQWVLNALNGTIDLHTGQCKPHAPADLISKQVPVVFDPDAKCPTWSRFVDRIMRGDQEKVRLLQQIVGLSLTGDVSVQKLFILVGCGQNGKSTFLNTLLAMLGDYAIQAEPNLLFAKKAGSHPTGQADLVGRRLAVCSESNDGHSFDEAVVKRLTGGDRIRARFMGKDFFEFDPNHKLILASNHHPVVHGTDKGIQRRLVLIPFDQTITDTERDDHLGDKLKAELPGILIWAVQGCLDWQENGLVVPGSIMQATRDYLDEMDIIGMFIREMCSTGPNLKIGASELYHAYERWATAQGERPLSQRRFGKSLMDTYFAWLIMGIPVRAKKLMRSLGRRRMRVNSRSAISSSS